MRQRRTILPLLLVTLLLCSGFTCKHKALQTSAGVAASLKALQDSEISLYSVKPGYCRRAPNLQEGFKTLAQTDKSPSASASTMLALRAVWMQASTQ
jgi:hypothetical protein